MNFFFSISVHDRIRYPIQCPSFNNAISHDDSSSVLPSFSSPSYSTSSNNITIDNISINNTTDDDYSRYFQHAAKESRYFEAFKKENHITHCEQGLYCEDILKFLDPFFSKMKQSTTTSSSSTTTNTTTPQNTTPPSLQSFLESFTSYIHQHPSHLRELMKTMNVKQLISPYIELDLPVRIIDEFNRLEEGDPKVKDYQHHPMWGHAIKDFGFFLDRYESIKDVLCLFVWSTVDRCVVPMPAVGLNPYPLCWVCDKGFGTISCHRCGVAKYCSRACQRTDWLRHSGPLCDVMSCATRRVKVLSFSLPPIPASPHPPSPHLQDSHQKTPSPTKRRKAVTSPATTTSPSPSPSSKTTRLSLLPCVYTMPRFAAHSRMVASSLSA
eukprot:TRINITY_DN5093_c0_g1_i1.p1 TRINITY_DN5093_c0_g1~~TRINITY_DN5093_c0_g1_i1.p1  ORF type:complete len:382 (+),score=106.48 TRINITY_DN5093_c0_g1_i1:97-1242(+)